MAHFYTQQKATTNYKRSKQKKKNKKKTPKISLKKNERQLERECKNKWNFRPVYSIAYCWRTANRNVRQNELCWQNRSSCKRGFWMANNIACCCASMGTRILLNSLVDLVTGWVRSCFHTASVKWLTWNHCMKKKKREGYRFASYFVNRFVFLLFLSKKNTKPTGFINIYIPDQAVWQNVKYFLIIIYLHSASRLTDKFTNRFSLAGTW